MVPYQLGNILIIFYYEDGLLHKLYCIFRDRINNIGRRFAELWAWQGIKSRLLFGNRTIASYHGVHQHRVPNKKYLLQYWCNDRQCAPDNARPAGAGNWTALSWARPP